MAAPTKQTSKQAQIVLLGGHGVGKTSLARVLMNNSAELGEAYTTLGFEIPANSPFALRDFSSTKPVSDPETRALLGKHDAIALLVNPAASADEDFQGSRYWLGLLGQSHAKRFLVGTHSDRWTEAEGTAFAEMANKFRLDGVFQTSARTRAGIEDLRVSLQRAAEGEPDLPRNPVVRAMQDVAEKLCKAVAEDSEYLNEVEWRLLEHMIATALKAVGFSVELTTPAKDGGKDVIARCSINGNTQVFYVEIKHWQKNRPSLDEVDNFVEVNAQDNTDGGLFLSSSGYTKDTYSCVGRISKQHVYLGEREKIITLCQYYASDPGGIMRSVKPLPEILFERTLREVPDA